MDFCFVGGKRYSQEMPHNLHLQMDLLGSSTYVAAEADPDNKVSKNQTDLLAVVSLPPFEPPVGVECCLIKQMGRALQTGLGPVLHTPAAGERIYMLPHHISC